METGLRGKTALITGGASGIGRGIALVLAEEGVELAVASRNPDPAVIDEISSNGHYVTRMTGAISPEIEQKMLEEMIPLHRFGEVGEIGNAVAFLLSDRLSGYTVGGDLAIDGGLTLHPLGLYSQEEIDHFNL